uniref:Uncharacterized protein n=1 Tax=Alexandrium monilatum TaxID=311494 RepID=A0A7S4Q804_9DINO
MARWRALWYLWPWACSSANNKCWGDDFTADVCCGDEPQRSDCWAPEYGLSRESCCGDGAAKLEPGGPTALHRANAIVLAINIAVDYLMSPGNCTRAVSPLLTYLRHFHASAAAALGRWLRFRSTEDKLASRRECAGRTMAARHTQLILLEMMLAFLGRTMSTAQGALRTFQALSSDLWASIHRDSRRAWADAGPASRSPKRRLLLRQPLACCMHIAMVASVGLPVFGKKAMAGVRSALYFATDVMLVFHLLVDREGESDVRASLDKTEGWLLAKGRFEFYRVDQTLGHVWQRIHNLLPADCLNVRSHYGPSGFLRLYAHEIIQDASVEVVLWVDAGDYVFMHNPAHLLQYHLRSTEEQVVGAPVGHPLPFQLYDLPRMRRANWSDVVAEVAREGYDEMGAEFCGLGEGLTMNRLTQGARARFWFWLPSRWAYEPWTDWMPGYGVGDLWTPMGGGMGAVWRDLIFPGLRRFQLIQVHCPSAVESLSTLALLELHSSSQLDASNAHHVLRHESLRAYNQSFTDPKGQFLSCNDRALGVHLVMPFHFLPWAHRFLNFWAGARVWDSRWSEGRELRTPSGQWAASAGPPQANDRTSG